MGRSGLALLLGLTLSCASLPENLYTLRAPDGTRLLSRSDAETIEGAGKGVGYVKSLAGKRNAIGQEMTAYRIAKLAQLGVSVQDALAFTDTAKPDAILAYPLYAANDFIDPTENRKPLLDLFRQEYDVWAVVADGEQDIYKSIAYLSSAKAIVISGHGDPVAVEIGKSLLNEGVDDGGRSVVLAHEEPFVLDHSDAPELQHYLAMLPQDAVIFVRACSTAQGPEPHLASVIKDAAGGRKVIAATQGFADVNEHYLSIHPLDLRITSKVDLAGGHRPGRLYALEDVVGKSYAPSDVPEIDYTYQ